MQNMVHKLPVLGEHEATDPAKIVKWAKDTLNLGRAVPKLLEGYNLLHFSVSKDIRLMWAALTADVKGSPLDDYPEDMDLDSEEEAVLVRKREWHVEWLETVIAYYGTNQQDSVFDVVRRIVKWNWDATLATELKINQWALSCAKAQSAVSEEAWSAADAKALFTACAKVLPEEVKSLLNQNKPAEGHHTWQTAAKFLNAREGLRCGRSVPKCHRICRYTEYEAGSGTGTLAIQMARRRNGSRSGAAKAARTTASADVAKGSIIRWQTRPRRSRMAREKASLMAKLVANLAARRAATAASASVKGKVTRR